MFCFLLNCVRFDHLNGTVSESHGLQTCTDACGCSCCYPVNSDVIKVHLQTDGSAIDVQRPTTQGAYAGGLKL